MAYVCECLIFVSVTVFTNGIQLQDWLKRWIYGLGGAKKGKTLEVFHSDAKCSVVWAYELRRLLPTWMRFQQAPAGLTVCIVLLLPGYRHRENYKLCTIFWVFTFHMPWKMFSFSWTYMILLHSPSPLHPMIQPFPWGNLAQKEKLSTIILCLETQGK